MSNILLLVLVIYLSLQLIEHGLSFLNLRHLARHGAQVPSGFEGAVAAETLAGMRDYTVAKEKAALVGSLLDMGLTLMFLFGGLLNWYNNWVAGFGYSFMVSGLIFFLVLMLAGAVVKIPLDLYLTFVVEERFGFNLQTLGQWCGDFVKGLLVSTLLSAMLLSGALWLIDSLPQTWWLLVWLFFLLFTLFVMYLSPYVIEPLFNKFTPIEDEDLVALIKSAMEKAGLAVSQVFSMDASKRSKHSNAYFTGIGHVKRIVLFDTLLAGSSAAEVVAILAHEAGHWKRKHLMKRLLGMELVALAGLYGAHQLVQSELLGHWFGLDNATIYSRLMLAAFILGLVAFPLKPLMSWWSRSHEREADDFAVQLVGQGKHLAAALVRLGTDNLTNLHPHPLYAAFYYSHPPMVQRVQALLDKK